MAESLIRFDTNAARLDKALAIAPDIVREEMYAFLLAAGIHLEAEVKERTPTGAHQLLRQSITHEVQYTASGMLGVIGSPLDYAEAVELGTKPHWAPIKPLEEWAMLKLGLASVEAKHAAKRIQYAIAHRGTLGVGMFHRAFAANRGGIARQFQATVRRIEARIGG